MNTNDIIEYAKTLKIRSDEIRAESKRLSALAGKEPTEYNNRMAEAWYLKEEQAEAELQRYVENFRTLGVLFDEPVFGIKIV